MAGQKNLLFVSFSLYVKFGFAKHSLLVDSVVVYQIKATSMDNFKGLVQSFASPTHQNGPFLMNKVLFVSLERRIAKQVLNPILETSEISI